VHLCTLARSNGVNKVEDRVVVEAIVTVTNGIAGTNFYRDHARKYRIRMIPTGARLLLKSAAAPSKFNRSLNHFKMIMNS
jgi:predicted RNA-binding protein with PUA domain